MAGRLSSRPAPKVATTDASTSDSVDASVTEAPATPRGEVLDVLVTHRQRDRRLADAGQSDQRDQVGRPDHRAHLGDRRIPSDQVVHRSQMHPRPGPAAGGREEPGALLALQAQRPGEQFGGRALRTARLAGFQITQRPDADHGPLGEVGLRQPGPLPELTQERGEGW